MKTVGAFQAKTHFSALLTEVQRGETVVVTRNGKPVARIVPADERRSPQSLIDRVRLRASRARFSADEIRDLIDEGRKS